MSAITWDEAGKRFYETGTKHGVLYVFDPDDTHAVNDTHYVNGVAWNGLTGVTVSPEGADATDLYADDIKYLTMRSAENVKATIEAYTYPDEWAVCDGSAIAATGVTIGQQPRSVFGFVWTTVLGNDELMDKYGEKIHILWGCTASPSEKAYQTINDSPEAITFSWEVSSTPLPCGDFKPTAYMEIDCKKANATDLATLKGKLYGTDGAGGNDPYLPMPSQIITIMSTTNS